MDKFLGNKTILRVVALVLACMLWLIVNEPDGGLNNNVTGQAPITVTSEHRLTSQQAVRINVAGTPANGYTIGAPATNFPYVELSGAKSVMDRVAEVVASVDVQNATQTVSQTVRLQAIDASGRPVEGVEIRPATTVVNVPVQSPKVIASVIPQITGLTKSGFVVSGVEVSPDFVVLSGSPQVVTSLQNVNVPVDVTGLATPKTLKVTLPNMNGVTKMEPKTLLVKVTVEPSLTRFFPSVTIHVKNNSSAHPLSVTSPQAIGVTVSGPDSIVRGLTSSDLNVVVDAGQLSMDETTAPITVMAPNWIQVTHLSVSTAKIQWK